MIEVRNLVKKYGGHLAIDHISFTVEKGQIYGFLGPNGAGKSTTMNIMTGYLGATEGEVLINGYDILKEPEKAKKCLGYLPEQPPLYVDMTVMEYLEFAAELKQVKKQEIEKEITKVIEMVRLEEVQNRLIKNLSKGYKQRVGLAQAVLGFPEIIILDEPTVGLDPKQIIEIRELIRELAKEHTVILSSHILAEVREVCDYVLIISKGKLVASDTPDNLEHLMHGSETVELLVKGTQAVAEEILKSVLHIVEVVAYKELTDGTTEIILKVESGQDIREELFSAFASAGCALLGLNQVKVTLEDVFLELTQNEQPQNEQASELEAEVCVEVDEIAEEGETQEDESNL